MKCSNRPLALTSRISMVYISANDTVTPMPVLEDTISELTYFQTTRIYGYGNC